jgi:membrane-bound lytic murein transglycosylase A
VLPQQQAIWQGLCEAAASLPARPDTATARAFFERHFVAQRLSTEEGTGQGLLTGYYEPLLMGSYTPDERFQYPLYQSPGTMLTLELASVYPELKDKRVRGRLVEGKKVVPYYSRAEIDGKDRPLAGEELLWVDNREDLFFLHVQGSGRVQLPDGKRIGVNYANHNGHPYVALGRRLIEWNALTADSVNMFSIKQWLRENPDKAETLYNENPSYVFFTLREHLEAGPLGSLGVPLTAERSLAVDRRLIELGSVLWVESHYPEGDQAPLQKLVFAQDTGGAIQGPLRGDLFFGTGQTAALRAGLMAQPLHLYWLQPKHSIE